MNGRFWQAEFGGDLANAHLLARHFLYLSYQRPDGVVAIFRPGEQSGEQVVAE